VVGSTGVVNADELPDQVRSVDTTKRRGRRKRDGRDIKAVYLRMKSWLSIPHVTVSEEPSSEVELQ
jgi:hypothetical protein